MKYTFDSRQWLENPHEVPPQTRHAFGPIDSNSPSRTTHRRASAPPTEVAVVPNTPKYWKASHYDVAKPKNVEASTAKHIAYQGIAWKSNGPAAKNKQKGTFKKLLHAVGISIFLLGIMSGAVFAAYYVLTCYGVY